MVKKKQLIDTKRLERELFTMFAKPCCGISPVIFKNNRWVCSECESDNALHENQLELFEYFSNVIKDLDNKKCDCGASKTSNTNCHANWCSIK